MAGLRRGEAATIRHGDGLEKFLALSRKPGAFRLSRTLRRWKRHGNQPVPELDEKALAAMLATDDAKAAGFIYMLRSLSEHPDIEAVPNL